MAAGTRNEVLDAVAAAGPRLIPPGSKVLAACSGGADSVALAAALYLQATRLQVRVALGHVDHGLRPTSPAEAEEVRALAARFDAPFHLARLGELKGARHLGLEAAAREARYAALAELAREAGASIVATAHTRRDQAETVLLRLSRGGGPGSLAGVRERRQLCQGVTLVRPLLAVPRSATESFCAQLGLRVVEDPHNDDPARARTRARRLLPLLARELNPRLEEALARSARAAADEDELLDQLARRALGALRRDEDLDVAELAVLHPALARRCLAIAAREAAARPEGEHLEELLRLLRRRRGELSMPGGRALLAGGLLRFESAPFRPPEERPPEVAIPGPGRYAWGDRLLVVAEPPLSGKANIVDVERAPLPWMLRGHRPGDRFRPGGGRTKKVAALWIDARIPRFRRAGLAVLADARGKLFWVEGLRAGESARGPIGVPIAFALGAEMGPRI